MTRINEHDTFVHYIHMCDCECVHVLVTVFVVVVFVKRFCVECKYCICVRSLCVCARNKWDPNEIKSIKLAKNLKSTKHKFTPKMIFIESHNTYMCTRTQRIQFSIRKNLSLAFTRCSINRLSDFPMSSL